MKIILTVLIMLVATNAQAKCEREFWLQPLAYIKHLDDDWTWTEGTDNRAIGIEARNCNLTYGAETFVNSFGDRSVLLHVGGIQPLSYSTYMHIRLGLASGYRKEYQYDNGEYYRNKGMLTDAVMKMLSVGFSKKFKEVEMEVFFLGDKAVGFKLNFLL